MASERMRICIRKFALNVAASFCEGVPQPAAITILGERYAFTYGFTYGPASLVPPSFAKEALSASRF